MSDPLFSIFQIITLIFSAIIHEVAHGATAYYYGDPTAKMEGRLTLNPLKHLDMFGSIIMPISLYILTSGSFVFGWAKPVPINPFNLKNPKRDSGIISLAGPVSNIIVAIIFALTLKGISGTELTYALPRIDFFLEMVIFINISLAIFNLVPIPPLDGSNLIFAFLPEKFRNIEYLLRANSLWLMLFLLFFGFKLLFPLVIFIFNLLV